MLVEIQCDKFIKHGEIRKPIQFHAGLKHGYRQMIMVPIL